MYKKNIFFFFLNLMFIILMLFILNFLMMKKKDIFQIESGYQNLDKTSLKSFSINFFFFLILFIIFDLELIILIPSLFKKNFIFSLLCSNFILLTFLLEWIMNKILWMN